MYISSDEEEVPLEQSTPIKIFPLNVLQALNLNTESTVARQRSWTSPDNTDSIFESAASPRKIDTLAGRGSSFTSNRIQRPREQSATVVEEIPHCTDLPAFHARGALSRPAPGRCFPAARESQNTLKDLATDTKSIFKIL